jgi:hypothetical protein
MFNLVPKWLWLHAFPILWQPLGRPEGYVQDKAIVTQATFVKALFDAAA